MSGAVQTREVAYRVFADEFDAASYTYAESEEERAPQYLVTPTGARVNRAFAVGVLTETEEVSEGVLRARIVDPTGAFVCYAGQYQPDALAFFERATSPQFVALTGKARTFEPEDSDRVFTSIRPERVNEVDATTRDTWVVQTALHTLERTGLLAMALEQDARGEELQATLESAGVGPALAAGIPRAIAAYEPTTGYLAAVQEMALDAVRVVTGDREEVEGVGLAPDEGGEREVHTGFTDVTLDSADAPAPERDSGIEESEPPDTPAERESAADVGAEESATGEAPPAEEESVAEPTAERPSPGESTEDQPASGASSEAHPAPGDAEADRGTEDEPMQSTGDAEPAERETETAVDEEDLYELSEEERAEVHENYDVGFESGTEVTSPEGESGDDDGVEPTSDEPAEATPGEGTSPDSESDAQPETDAAEQETAAGEPADSGEEYADAADLSEGEVQNLVVSTLRELGEGDGVPRGTLKETLTNRHGLSEEAIESAIEDALLGGRCFESGSDALKPI
ncbi:MAG: hypothetical protein ABEJ60_02240 [Halodesulfurarchaeum sp.]